MFVLFMWVAFLGLYSLRRCPLINIGIPMIHLRKSSDRLRFIMGIPIPVRRWIEAHGLCSIFIVETTYKIYVRYHMVSTKNLDMIYLITESFCHEICNRCLTGKSSWYSLLLLVLDIASQLNVLMLTGNPIWSNQSGCLILGMMPKRTSR